MNVVKNIEDIKMNQELVMDRAIVIALIGIGLYAFFALVDLVKTKRGNK